MLISIISESDTSLSLHHRADRSLTGMGAVPLSRDSIASTSGRGKTFGCRTVVLRIQGCKKFNLLAPL